MPAMGPLRPHPINPRYFADPSGRPVYLSGSHTWANFATDQGPSSFDYPGYLAAMERHGHNFFRGWVWDLPWSRQGYNGGPFRFGPSAWQRTGPGLATDGEPRFDLTAWNDAFFERIRARTELARDRGIYVAIMLFQGYGWQFDRADDDGFPYDGRNNVNGVDCGPGYGASTLDHPGVVAVQEAYVRRVADTVADLDNVLYEIANEAGPHSTDWQVHHIRQLQAYERARGTSHPVGMTFQYEGGTLEALQGSPADWISPDCDAATRADPPVTDGRHVIVYDTDHGHDWRTLRREGPAGYRSWVWRSFCRGGNALLMDPWLARIEIEGEVRNAPKGAHPDDPRFGLRLDPFWEPYRASLGAMRTMSRRLDLARLVPRPELSSSRYCLAAPGQEYLVYLPDPASEVVVELDTGGYSVTWIDPVTAAPATAAAAAPADPADIRAAVGGPERFQPPGAGDAALHLVRVS